VFGVLLLQELKKTAPFSV